MSKKIEEQASEEVLTAAELSQEEQAAETDEVLVDYEAVVVIPEIGLNLRGAPTTEAPILTVLPQGTVLRVIPLPYKEPDWCPVVAGIFIGWVDRRYIEALEPDQEG